MTKREQRKADLESLGQLAAALGVSTATTRFEPIDRHDRFALARQLPRLLACAKFVESYAPELEHALRIAAGEAHGFDDAHQAIVELRKGVP